MRAAHMVYNGNVVTGRLNNSSWKIKLSSEQAKATITIMSYVSSWQLAAVLGSWAKVLWSCGACVPHNNISNKYK